MTLDPSLLTFSRIKIIVCFSSIVGLLCVSMFIPWEPSGETWGYWYFSRVFSETGGFIIPDRSPLYILYIKLFSWISYPTSVTVEYIFTTGVVVIALFILFRSFVTTYSALIASCIWIPYLQFAEPPVQKLALACSILAVLFRRGRTDEFRIILSYTFLLLAYLFRQTYILLIITFLTYDIYSKFQLDRIKWLISWRLKPKNIWPLALTVLLIIWFVTSQSSSSWNNVWFTDTQWFPNNGKTMSGGGIQSMNWIYIFIKYGTFEGHDFYFTNQEAFGGATNFIGAAIANPRVILDIIIFNFYNLPTVMMTGIWLPRTGVEKLDYIFSCIVLITIIFGALKGASDSSLRILVVGSLLLACVSVLAVPKWRYMMPMIPVFILAASWYGSNLSDFLKSIWLTEQLLTKRMALLFAFVGLLFAIFYVSTDHSGKPMRAAVLFVGTVLLFSIAGLLILVSKLGSEKANDTAKRFALMLPTLVFIIIFSSTQLFEWAKLFYKIENNIKNNNWQVMESKEYSTKAAYPELLKVTNGCKGILSLESLFLGAFTAVPLNKIYSPWEIPPFGSLHDSSYTGLNPDRIDCVLISSDLATGVGAGTNIQIRYQNFVKPYVDNLRSIGAITYDIDGFGQAVVFNR